MRKFLLYLRVLTWCFRIGFRFVSGRPMSGNVYSDASLHFFRRGTRALTRDGIVSSWAMRPGWQRAAFRLAAFPGLPVCGILYLLYPTAVTAVAAAAAAAAGAFLTIRIVSAIRQWRFRRTVINPLAAALSPVIEMTPRDIIDRLELAGPEATEIKVPLPDHFGGRVDQVKSVDRIVTQRVGNEWDADMNLRNHPFYIRMTPTPAPPRTVPFEQVRELVLAAEEHKPLLGLGPRGGPIHLDFKGEIAHLGCSIGTQGGKSSFARYLTGHFAHHGVEQLMCDVKQVSILGMEQTPGLRICRNVEEIWEALAGVRAEMDNRYSILAKNPTRTFPRKVVYLEEQNAFAVLTRQHWADAEVQSVWKEQHPGVKAPRLAPVWNDIALLLVMAAQVNINIVGFYQRMGAAECGGGSYRDQYGMKLLGRFSPAAWDSLVGERPRGKSENDIPGRAISIMGSSRRTVQLPLVSVAEAMELATSGTPVTVTSPVNHQVRPRDSVTVTPMFSLREAAEQDWCPVSYDSLRQRKSRGKLHLPAGDRWTQAELVAALTDHVQETQQS